MRVYLLLIHMTHLTDSTGVDWSGLDLTGQVSIYLKIQGGQGRMTGMKTGHMLDSYVWDLLTCRYRTESKMFLFKFMFKYKSIECMHVHTHIHHCSATVVRHSTDTGTD